MALIGRHGTAGASLADICVEAGYSRGLPVQRFEDVALEASMCKYFATEMCGRVADRCVQMFGGAGYIADHSSIERWYRDIRLFRLCEGTSQIHQLNIARLALRDAT